MALASTLVGCTSTAPRRVAPQEFVSILQQRGLPDPIVPFTVTEEMRDWLGQNVSRSSDVELRLASLTEALLADSGLGIRYERLANLTAAEVFQERTANCLSFTMLFVGLARELNIPATFIQVRDLERVRKEGDLVILSDHVAVGIGPLHDLRIVDFARDEPSYRSLTLVSDLEAVGLYYSNRGAEALRHGDLGSALPWLESATRVAPSLSAAWVNLGVARRRQGDREGAEGAYRRAIEVDPGASSAYHNLAALLRMKGRTEEARDLLALSTEHRSRNPYAYLALGEHSARHGRTADALAYYKKAAQLGRDQADVLASYGMFRLTQGQRRHSERLLRRARKLDPQSSRVKLLAQRLEGASG